MKGQGKFGAKMECESERPWGKIIQNLQVGRAVLTHNLITPVGHSRLRLKTTYAFH